MPITTLYVNYTTTQNIKNMALTNIQKQNIHALDTDTVIEILHECVERLGLVSVKEYCKINCRKHRITYLDIKNNKIRNLKLSENIYCIINE